MTNQDSENAGESEGGAIPKSLKFYYLQRLFVTAASVPKKHWALLV